MMDITALKQFIESKLDGTEYFLVDLKVTAANEITVEIDSMQNVDLDFVIELSKAIESAFPRDDEDYELEVGSAGLTSPFKVRAQYEKNIGNKVEVLTADGRKLHGTLTEATENHFTIESLEKIKDSGMKRPVVQAVPHTFAYTDVKSVKYELEF